MELRTLVGLAGTLVCAAIAAHATGEVQAAREQQPVLLSASLDDMSGAAVPESPVAIAAVLGATEELAARSRASGTPTVDLRLDITEAPARDSLAWRGQFDVNPLDK